ncbi:mechanosensitive ion channel domain-containing protein [Gallaecimonas sp. GXIMD4217]|uniref:mechanosensitive ion channel domain-containing protein n=1 Tax=Gallaecimonas sp. GXIMD4217 TaxID=3131927 RepID=UPI00311AD357
MPFIFKLLFTLLLLTAPALASGPAKLLGQPPQQEAPKQRLENLFEARRQAEQRRDQHQARAEQLRQLLDNYPKLVKGLESQLQRYQAQPLGDLAQWPEEKLEQTLSLRQARQLEFNTELDKVNSELAAIGRQDPARTAVLKEEIRQLQDELNKAGKGSEEAEARRALLDARIQALAAEAKARELEVLTANQRKTLGKLNQQLLELKLVGLGQQLSALNQALNSLRQSRTEEALAQSQQQQYQHQALIKLASDNAALAQALTGLNDDILRVQQRQRDLELGAQDYGDYLAFLEEQLDYLKFSATFGEALRTRYDRLPRPKPDSELEQAGTEARLAKFQYSQRLRALPASAELAPDLSQAQQAQADSLLGTQRQLLERLLARSDDYLDRLSTLKAENRQLGETIGQVRRLIESHLFWIPNAAPLDKHWLSALPRSALELARAKAGGWRELHLGAHPLLLALVMALLALAALTRWLELNRLRVQLAELARPVGNVTRDSIRVTLQAMGLSLLYAAPLPLLWLLLAWQSGPAQPALAATLLVAAGGFAFWLCNRNLTHEEGVMQSHFRWRAAGVRRIRLLIRRLVWVAMPLTMLMVFCQLQDDVEVRHGLGRAAFLVLALGLALFYQQLYKHRDILVYHLDKGVRPRSWHHLLWWLAIAVPLACFGLAIRGYYFTAQQLLWQQQLSLLLILGFVFAYYLAKRWLLIEKRKIAFNRAKAKRAELLALRAKEEAHEVPSEEALLDLDTIASQSLGLMRTLFKLMTVLSLLVLWSSMYDALNYLDTVELWDVTRLVDGDERTVPVTLMALIWSLLAFSLTLMALRNLPGLLELMVLQRLKLSPGTGFAITTISKYLLMLVGTITGFGLLGIDWSKLQWLVAALTVGLGFGLQEIFANFVSGLIILFEKPIRIGDTVTIRELSGTVARINTRATTIVDWDRKEIIVPNKAFITEQFINWSLSDPITRIILKVGIKHGTDTTEAQRVLLEAARSCALVLDQPEPTAYLLGIGPSSLDFELRLFVGDTDSRLQTSHEVYAAIHRQLIDRGIALAHQQLDVHWHKGKP